MGQPDQIYMSDSRRTLDNTTLWGQIVKNYGWDATNLIWRPIAVNEDGETITGASLIQQSMSFFVQGDAVVNNFVIDGIYFKNDVKITKVALFNDKSPTGADMIVDQTVGGVALGKAATLSDGSQYEETDTADLSVLTTDRYGLKFIQVGSTIPGSGIKVVVFYEKL